MTLCNESEVNGEHGNYLVKGSATENALIYLGINTGIDIVSLKQTYPLLKINQRSQDRNYMTSLHPTPNGEKLVAVKGSPTEVLAMCTWELKDGKILALSDSERLTLDMKNDRMAGNGLRVLAAAYLIDHTTDIEDREDLIWLALVGMKDPIRNGVKQLMGEFHQAGIDTVMITGDPTSTAYAIAK